MDSAQVLDDALGQVGHAEANSPVSVALQLDHLIGTETHGPCYGLNASTLRNTCIFICNFLLLSVS